MSEGFAYIDILFFAMVAAFIALRLRSVLGRRTGHERRRTEGFGDVRSEGATDNVVPIGDHGSAPPEIDQAIAALGEGDVKDGLTRIREVDPHFDLKEFLSGARLAFEMIVDAYAAGDKTALRPLLADQVFRGFARAIDERVAIEQSLDTQLLAVSEPEVIEADLVGQLARVTLRFDSEQVNVIRDRDGKVVEGDPQTAENVVDLWTFERDTESGDPNWMLIETRTPN
ncbi:MAG: Tim44/TimA family putative adaptor protein [Alphaproteobacteria bacterium]|nr:Tim44/TimA family putative adaptor protein [Alphaproteobacteria bacterium]